MLGLLIVWLVGMIRPEWDLRWLDPVVAILVALMILRTAWNLTREATRDLVDVNLPDEDVDWIRARGGGLAGRAQPAPHAHPQGGLNRFIDFHLVVDSNMSVGRLTPWEMRSWRPSRSGCPSRTCRSTWSPASSNGSV